MFKPDIVTIIQNEGIELKSKGRSFWTQCPLHSEKTPSFKVDPGKQLFYCFGCHEHGDVIDFVQKYKNLSFKEASQYLGIDGKPYRPDPKEIRKRKLLQQFRQWCNDYFNDICSLYRTLQRAKTKARTLADVEDLSEFYHQEPLWLQQMEILTGDDDNEKLNLYRGVLYGC